MITLLLFTAIYIPYRVSFLDKVSTGWLVVEYLVDILFFTDIPINFLSAYMDNEKNLVTEKKKIAINYLKGWFIIDAIAWYYLYNYYLVFHFSFSPIPMKVHNIISYSDYYDWEDYID